MTLVTRPEGDRRVTRPIDYPTGDGKPVAETEKHRDLMIYCIDALSNFYAARQDVQVSGNNFVFYQEGNPKARVSPDCYVVFGVAKKVRDSYMTWKEGGQVPAVVFEFTSKKTQREDVRRKRPLYEQVLRVPEYFQFDPTGDYLNPRLQGFRLLDGLYVPIPLIDHRLRSTQLGLELVQEGERLRLFDPIHEEWLLSASELAQQAAELTQRAVALTQQAEAERIRAERAEMELVRLRAELTALRQSGDQADA